MARLPGNKFKIYGLVAFLVGAGLLLTLRFKSIFGQESIIILLESPQEMDSLRAALEDEGCFGALTQRLAYSSIWHIGSTSNGSGFKHVFYFGGKKRSMERVEGVTAKTILDESGKYKVSMIGEEFAHRELGSNPDLRDAQGLEILKAALGDDGVRNQILVSLREESLQLHSVVVQTIKPNSSFNLLLSGALPNQQTLRMTWQVLKDSADSPYVFLND
jgi:hypothetical protein